MAGPTDNLPQLVTRFVPRGPTPYGNPGVPVPVAPVPAASNFVSRQATGAPGYTSGSPPVTPVVAAPAIPAGAPAAVAPPSVPAVVSPPTGVGVSPTPGAGNPLPPSMRGGDTGLPVGPVPGGAAAGGAAPRLVTAFPLLSPPNLQRVFTNGANGGSQIDPGGIEVNRGGVVSRYDGGGNLVSGPGGQGEAAYNALLAANPNNGVGNFGTAYAAAAPGGAASAGIPGAGGGVGGLTNPAAAINAGFDTQTARAQNFIDQARAYVDSGDTIFERATRGRFINGLLSATVGPNNVGQVQGQGADTLNSAISGITQAGIGAGAQIGVANINQETSAQRNTAAERLEGIERANTPAQIGQRFVQPRDAQGNPFGLPVAQPIYGLPALGSNQEPTGYRVINGGTGAVAPAPQKPTLSNFIRAARAANPGKSDTELTNYYNQTYGQ